jgi:hypothetical protein
MTRKIRPAGIIGWRMTHSLRRLRLAVDEVVHHDDVTLSRRPTSISSFGDDPNGCDARMAERTR